MTDLREYCRESLGYVRDLRGHDDDVADRLEATTKMVLAAKDWASNCSLTVYSRYAVDLIAAMQAVLDEAESAE